MASKKAAAVIPASNVLVIRKREDGSHTVEGDIPAEHAFSARWIAQAIESGLVTVTVQLNTENGPHVLRMTGFQQNESGGADLTTWAVTQEGTDG